MVSPGAWLDRPERRGAGKGGAPGLARRSGTLAREHRSGTAANRTGGSGGEQFLLVSFEQFGMNPGSHHLETPTFTEMAFHLLPPADPERLQNVR